MSKRTAVFHFIDNVFGNVVKVAEFETQRISTARALDEAYAATQNIDEAWRPSAPCRSSMVGDLFRVEETDGSVDWYMVMGIGFAKLENAEQIALLNNKFRVWNTASIRKLLDENDKMVERSILVLYDRQTADEQVTGVTREENGVGFTGVDAEILTSFAEQIKANKYGRGEGQRLSFKQRELARRKLGKYARQLAEAAQQRAAR